MDRIAAVWPEYLLFEPRLYEPGSHAVIGHCGFPAELKKKGRLCIYLFIYRSRPTFFFQAVDLLKDSTVLNLIISRGAGSDFISPGESSGYNSAASSINGDQSPMQNGKQKRLSIVREEIMDVIDERYNADIVLFFSVCYLGRRNNFLTRFQARFGGW